MIHSPNIEHQPIRVLADYFENALADIGAGIWYSLLRPGMEDYFRERISGSIHAVHSNDKSLVPWKQRRENVLRRPQDHLRWEPWEDPADELWAHYRMQSAIAATLMGDHDESKSLLAMLVTEPMNRKLFISHFLGNLTEGRIGGLIKELPTKSQILEWVQASGIVGSTDKLEEIAKLKYE